MKRTLFLIVMALTFCVSGYAQAEKYDFVNAKELNIEGQFFENLPNVYHRLDTAVYKGFTKGEGRQMLMSAGKIVFFRTNSTVITINPKFGKRMFNMPTTMNATATGFDLYIRDGERWNWAAHLLPDNSDPDKNKVMKRRMPAGMKECMLYLPMFSELIDLEIGVEKGADIEALETPFRHRILFHGSSFTHGFSTTRPGMAYPYQFMRMTGLLALNFGCSGNCKMQPYYADFLENIEADAYVFDSFSNPSAELIEKRLPEFVDRMVKAHPGKPIVFQQTIYREGRRYNSGIEAKEQAKMDMAEKLMTEICAKYPDVYFIVPNAADEYHDTSVDSTHPSDMGYRIWAGSIREPLLKIFKKYGIR